MLKPRLSSFAATPRCIAFATAALAKKESPNTTWPETLGTAGGPGGWGANPLGKTPDWLCPRSDGDSNWNDAWDSAKPSASRFRRAAPWDTRSAIAALTPNSPAKSASFMASFPFIISAYTMTPVVAQHADFTSVPKGSGCAGCRRCSVSRRSQWSGDTTNTCSRPR